MQNSFRFLTENVSREVMISQLTTDIKGAVQELNSIIYTTTKINRSVSEPRQSIKITENV